jgi:hypothetical protein
MPRCCATFDENGSRDEDYLLISPLSVRKGEKDFVPLQL